MKVSVTVLIYNSEKHLRQALMCLSEQTLKDFEAVLFDDHSTDGSPRICREFSANDPRFRHIIPPRRLGLQASRGAVLDECRGDYVAVLDSDDLSEPTRLEKQLAAITANPDIKLVTSLCGRVDENGRKTKHAETPWLDGAGLLWRLIFGNSIFHSSVLFERKLALKVGGYDPTLTTCEDADLYGRILKHGEAFCVNEILSYWRTHANNISRGIDHYEIKRRDALSVFQNLIYSFAGLTLDLDATEAIYSHVRAPAKDEAALRRAVTTIEKIFSALLTRFSTSTDLKKSTVREALISLADLQSINVRAPYWPAVKPRWRVALQDVLAEGRRLDYHWLKDALLFLPRRQLPTRIFPELINATWLSAKRRQGRTPGAT